MERYKLIKALVEDKGSLGTPIIGYVLKDNTTDEMKVCTPVRAFSHVSDHGCLNAEAKVRDEDGQTIYYLKVTDGKSITDYMLKIEDEV